MPDGAPTTVSVPIAGRAATPKPEQPDARRTAPLSVLVGALGSVQNAIFPAAAAAFGTGIGGAGLFIGLLVGAAVIGIGTFFSYVGWRRLTYTVGSQDIRVESGVLSRSARSVPYERIQDVSLEQKLLPRLFGLVAVRFETGAGGGDDLTLSFLAEEEGERLRQLVRERRDADTADRATADAIHASPEIASAKEVDGEALFAMGPSRLFKFGLFEFSLAVFAVLGGLLQYADTFGDFEIWDPDLWQGVIEEQGSVVASLGPYAQAASAVAGVVGLFIIGSATGMIRVFTREWGFLLERTPRGFRRRRGLFTRTDVVMPIHRVQGVKIGTGLIRYRFGWHRLRFVSLAQDAGSANHDVAPFAQMEEIAPIVEAAGFALPSEDADWRRAARSYRTDTVIWDSIIFVIAAVIAGVAIATFAPEWTLIAVGGPLAVGVLSAIANVIAWRFKRHALSATQIFAMSGILAPTSQIATRVKLHSVEIAQGPIARLRGYATVHLGLAGGEFAIPGVPLDRAREVRREVLQTIAATDFSQLEHA